MKITTKADGKLLKPWKIAQTIFHVEETARAKQLELIQKARLVPMSERKKLDGKDIFEPGDVFFMTMPAGKSPRKVPHVHWRSVVDWRILSLPQSGRYTGRTSDFCNCG